MRALPERGDGRWRALASRFVGFAPAPGASILRSPLFLKYVALFVAVVSVALVANAAFDVYFSYQEQKASLVRIQREQAQAAAGKIGQFISEIQSQLGWTVQLPWSAGTLEQRRFDALRLLRQVPAITELAEIDATGHEQLRVSRLAMDAVGSNIDDSKEPAFVQVVAHKVYYGPVYFRRQSEPYMTLALAGTRREAGVSVAQVNLKFIWDVLSGIKFSGHGRAYVVDAAGRLIAHPDISLVLRNTDMSQLAQVRNARAEASGIGGENVEEATDIEGQKVLTASAAVAPLGWFVLVESPLAEALAPLYASIERTGLVLLGALALAFAAGMFLARHMVVPIQALRAGAARIGSGDLGQRIAIKTGDEVEALADQFNDMAGRLQESYADLEKKVELRTHELSEALEQQTATSDVLRVIAGSAGDLEPVFASMLENAVRLCDATFGNIYRWDGDALSMAASFNTPTAFAAARRSGPMRPAPNNPVGEMIAAKAVVHVPDVVASKAYAEGESLTVAGTKLAGIRTFLAVPMLRDDELIGALALARQQVRPFTEKQITLVTSFADQAVIAIENTRLLTELRQRTVDLTESLEQQTATAQVLQAISRSTFDLQKVLDALVESAVKLCHSDQAGITRAEGEAFRLVASFGLNPELQAYIKSHPLLPPGRASITGRVLADGKSLHVHDVTKDPEFQTGELDRLGGQRTMLGVPLMRENAPIGVIALQRRTVQPFTEKEIELANTFADQAVIAIENARLLGELRQSLEQQTAATDVLRVISSSPGEVQPVFETILANATRLCEANFGVLPLREGDTFRTVAMHNAPAAFAELRRRQPVFRPAGGLAQMAATKQVLHAVDITAEPAFQQRDPDLVDFVELTGARTILAVPMLKDDEVIGAIVVYRTEPRAFADKQIALMQSFAAQAVIAIENARLVGELRQRTTDLTESLEQQTAISEILRVISNSPSDVQPVLDAVATHAARICEAQFVDIVTVDDGALRFSASTGELARPATAEIFPLDRSTVMGRSIVDGRPVHIADLQEAGGEFPLGRDGALRYGHRTTLAVPLIREGRALGTIMVRRREVRPFEQKHIALLQTFADQAALAIENVRLFNAEQQRTRELTESLEQQTATAQVLGVISSSPGDLQPVFDTMLENATRLCEAPFGTMLLRDGEVLRIVAGRVPPGSSDLLKPGSELIVADNVGHPLVRVLDTKDVIHFADVRADASYTSGNPRVVAFVETAGARTGLCVPMMKDDECIGAFVTCRQEVRPFRDKQIELVKNFAAQAVIAIENARLLSELRESLAQQTATAEVLGVISSSPGDLEPVFASMLESATRLCGASFGALTLRQGDAFRAAALYNMPAVFVEAFARERVFRPGPLAPLSRAVAGGNIVHIADLAEDAAYKERDPPVVALVDQGAVRAILVVPMLKDGLLVGALSIYRHEVRPFGEKQIELVRNFAAQAVIAIENTRLLTELRQRTTDLTESLEQQTATSEVLRVISSSPGELGPVFLTMLENATRICGASFGTLFMYEGDRLRRVARHHLPQKAKLYAVDDETPPHFIAPFDKAPSLKRLVDTRQVVHIVDIADEHPEDPIHTVAGARTILIVPMLKETELVGAFAIHRREVQPFGDKQIALVQNFAAQAVIAIENTRLLTELRESLERQTASSEVLQVINASPGDLAPVFDAIVDKAMRLCEAGFGGLWIVDGDLARAAVVRNVPEPFVEFLARGPLPHADAFGHSVQDRPVLHIADMAATESYRKGVPVTVASVELGGIRSYLAVPLREGGALKGVLVVYRKEVRPFNDRQIGLVQGFAAQAEIAMKNARLLNETQESLEQQTATSEVLRVISSSPGDLQPVFAAMLENATRICDAHFGNLLLYEGSGAFRIVAMHGARSEWSELRAREPVVRPSAIDPLGRLAATQQLQHVADVRNEAAYIARNPGAVAAVELGGLRTLLAVPILKDDELIGMFAIYRPEVRPFTDKQIALVQSFAAQAVIAIENTRLLTALRQRTDDLTESLEQQTATSEVLRVISSSPGDLEPVFETILANATRICEANFGMLFLTEGDGFRIVAWHGAPAEFIEAHLRLMPVVRGQTDTTMGRVAATKRPAQSEDIWNDAAYTPDRLAILRLSGARTLLNVPMLREDHMVGQIAIYRQQVQPFGDKQIELLQNFAAQAVIAIENTRLLTELRARTDELGRSVGELRALGEVSQAVNSTLDLETVLSTIVAKAVQLSHTDAGAIYVYAEAAREFRLRATYGMDGELVETLRNARVGFAERNIARLLSEREPVQVADLAEQASSDVDRIVLRAGYRSRLTAPLFRGDDIVGLLVVRRRTPGAFAQNTVDLIKTFAAQSAVAIQNARLFENVEARTRDLANSLQELRTAQDRLIQTEKLASLGQLTAGIAHEIKNPLNFVNNFSALSTDLIDELQAILKDAPIKPEQRAEVAELTDMLRGNLGKVVQHGKRADSIVKNMLLHSRQGSGEHQPTDVNALVEESLNLAYHGARAEKQGFNITMEKSLDPQAGTVELFPQEITRVLLNLITNGFYAATKRKAQTGGGDYEPTLSAATRNLGDRVEIRIRDNGTGIPPEVKEKMFNPFFTTKPAGEGTGLGLSLSHDIIVKQHSGSIEVDTQPGEFTEFRIVLPRVSAIASKPGGN